MFWRFIQVIACIITSLLFFGQIIFYCTGITHFVFFAFYLNPEQLLLYQVSSTTSGLSLAHPSLWGQDSRTVSSTIPIILDHHLNASLSLTWPQFSMSFSICLCNYASLSLFFSVLCVWLTCPSYNQHTSYRGLYFSCDFEAYQSCLYNYLYFTLWHDALVPFVIQS